MANQKYVASITNGTIPGVVYVAYFMSLQGSATQTVSITGFGLSGTATTGGTHSFGAQLLTSLAGGTPTVIPIAPYDTNNATATAVATQYATGTTPGGVSATTIRSWSLYLPAAATNAMGTQIINMPSFGDATAQNINLRGTNQYFVLMCVGAAPVGASLNAFIEWTEN